MKQLSIIHELKKRLSNKQDLDSLKLVQKLEEELLKIKKSIEYLQDNTDVLQKTVKRMYKNEKERS